MDETGRAGTARDRIGTSVESGLTAGTARRGAKSAQQELARLEAECRLRKVKLVYDDLRGEGGLCRVRKEFYIIVNRRLSTESRIRIIGSCLEKLPAQSESPAAAVCQKAGESGAAAEGRQVHAEPNRQEIQESAAPVAPTVSGQSQ